MLLERERAAACAISIYCADHERSCWRSRPDIHFLVSRTPVIKGTRIPLEFMFYRLKDGFPIETIQVMYQCVDLNVLEAAIGEAIQTITTTFHVNWMQPRHVSLWLREPDSKPPHSDRMQP